MEEKLNSHLAYIDILKAIGIISIVIGHSSWILPVTNFPIGPFVYSYHLMIFFFISGYNFKAKHAESPFNYIGKRVKSTLPYFVLYNTIFVLFHNVFIKYHMISRKTTSYGIPEILKSIINSFTYNTSEVLLGAMWFVPVLLFGSITFCFLFSFAQYTKHSQIINSLFILTSGCLGIYLNYKSINLAYHIQTSILAIPIFYLGYVLKCNWKIVKKYISFWISIMFIPIIYLAISSPYGIIELASNAIIHPLLFYPVTFLGIYFCLGIAKGITHIAIFKKCFIIIGKNSYHIMALHFLAFKLIDFIYGYIHHINGKTIEQFTHSFNFWPIYYVGGILIPLSLIFCVKKIIFPIFYSIYRSFSL